MIMKIIAYILNALLLIVMLFNEGFSCLFKSPEFFFIACPIVNIFALSMPGTLKESWLALYFKRKRLEEQQKIDALDNNGEQN